jgi:hypothetical protein
MLKIRRGSHGSPKALQPAAAKTIQFLAALAFKALQEPFRPRERLHPRNLLRHLCGRLKIQLVPLGESGTAVQPFNPSNQAGARGAGSSEFHKHTRHVEEALAGRRGARADRLLGRLQ